MQPQEPCFHGGAFFSAIGERFDALERSEGVINANVLDAWFPPSPRVLEALSEYLPWLLRTSPPTEANGLREAIAETYGLPLSQIAVGAGSSDLIFRVWPRLFDRSSRILLIEPSYGEYSHVAQTMIGSQVDTFEVVPETGFRIDVDLLLSRLKDTRYDCLVVVNPNNPTGGLMSVSEARHLLNNCPKHTLVWFDEAYVDYVGQQASVQRLVSSYDNLLVCKSMSKGFALSGARVAYLVASLRIVELVRTCTPPWCVSLSAQVAAVYALNDLPYYADRYQETHHLRSELLAELKRILPTASWFDSPANFLLGVLSGDVSTSGELVRACQAEDVFLRDSGLTAPSLRDVGLRVAVKGRDFNRRIVQALETTVLKQPASRQ